MIKSIRDKQRSLTCAEFENRVNQLLDSRHDLGADLLLEKHALGCKQCQSVIASYSIFNPFEDAPLAALAVAESVRGDQAAERPWLVLSVVAAAILACGLLLANVSQSAENGSVSLVLADSIASKSDALGLSLGEVGASDAARHVAVVGLSEDGKMPASLKAGQAFATANLRAVSWSELERNLESLQPVFGYSRRIPVVSSVQSTVDLTIGLIRANSQDGFLRSGQKNTTPHYGFLLNQSDCIA